ncbi:MAG: chemotaxis protein CheW [Spirochaetales bacterium]|nr:chemotaxis protein CheW [Spirochaetales bacterium]
MGDNDVLVQEFIVEALEHLETVEDDILEIERQGADTDSETVNHLFRSIHSIKGSSSFINLDKITKLSHSLENIIGNIREHKILPVRNVTDTLLKGVDKLKVMVNDCDHSNDIVIDRELEALEQLITSPLVQNTATKMEKDERQPKEQAGKYRSQTKIIQTHEIKSVMIQENIIPYTTHGYYQYRFVVDLVAECDRRNRKPADFFKNLEFLGNISESRIIISPDETVDNFNEQLLFNFVYSSLIDDEEMIIKSLDITPVKMERMTVGRNRSTLPADQVETGAPRIVSGIEEKPEETKVLAPTRDRDEKKASTAKASLPARTEMSTLRIPINLLDRMMNLASELVLVRNQNMQAIDVEDLNQLKTIAKKLNLVTSGLQASIMQTRLQPVDLVFSKFTRMVRDLCRSLGKEAVLELIGRDVELDKNIIEALNDPLMHLVRNAVDHGIEMPDIREVAGKQRQGRVVLSAFHRAGYVIIRVQDDGAGMNEKALAAAAVKKGLLTEEQARTLSRPEALNLIFKPGFTTASSVTDISGRGVGMDVVKSNIQKLGGIISITSVEGKGTEFEVRLPLTLTIMQALIVSSCDLYFALAQYNISEVVWLHGEDIYNSIRNVNGQEFYSLRGKLIPVFRLYEILKIKRIYKDIETGVSKEDKRLRNQDRRNNTEEYASTEKRHSRGRRFSLENSVYIIILKLGEIRCGLIIDDIVDTEEIVIKPLHEQLKDCKAFSGTTVLGDGRIALILDVANIAELGDMNLSKIKEEAEVARQESEDRQMLLVFSNEGDETYAIPLFLIAHIEKIRLTDIIVSNQKEYFQFQKQVIPVIRLENAFPASRAVYGSEGFIIILKLQKSIGILVSRLLDSTEVNESFDTSNVSGKGVLGAVMFNDKLTLILDVFKIVETLEPEWYTTLLPAKRGGIKRVLLIEDSEFYQVLLKSYLMSIGYSVVVAGNGREGLEALSKQDFDRIISDIEMPLMDGFAFAKEVKANPAWEKIPLTAISSSPETEEVRNLVLESGFDLYISKLNRKELFESLLYRI